ncbi:rCG61557, partial [Rattus norvegicus]
MVAKISSLKCSI